MAEYIDREKVLALQTDLHFDNIEQLKHWKCRHIDPTDVLLLPAADVRPVVRGYWHGEGDGYADGELVCDMWQCSCCGEWFDEWDDKPTWNFCPNCGADMRGGEAGE